MRKTKDVSLCSAPQRIYPSRLSFVSVVFGSDLISPRLSSPLLCPLLSSSVLSSVPSSPVPSDYCPPVTLVQTDFHCSLKCWFANSWWGNLTLVGSIGLDSLVCPFCHLLLTLAATVNNVPWQSWYFTIALFWHCIVQHGSLHHDNFYEKPNNSTDLVSWVLWIYFNKRL